MKDHTYEVAGAGSGAFGGCDGAFVAIHTIGASLLDKSKKETAARGGDFVPTRDLLDGAAWSESARKSAKASGTAVPRRFLISSNTPSFSVIRCRPEIGRRSSPSASQSSCARFRRSAASREGRSAKSASSPRSVKSSYGSSEDMLWHPAGRRISARRSALCGRLVGTGQR